MSITNSLSATMIGHGKSDADRHHAVRQNFRKEALRISEHTSQQHHSRRDKLMQIQYPETINRMCSSRQQNTRSEVKDTNTSQSSRPPSVRRAQMESEFLAQHSSNLKNEYMMNSRKKRFNRSSGSQAVVNDILTGRAPAAKEPIFPQNPSHQQVLMITGKLKMPDANVLPPDIPKPKKWLGNDRGWET